jgi:hypothetical protein
MRFERHMLKNKKGYLLIQIFKMGVLNDKRCKCPNV